MIITIDGPAGSGKSTAARRLAQRLGVAYLDTGAMYRAVTLRALRNGVDLRDGAALAECAAQADIQLRYDDGDKLRVWLDGRDVTAEIRSAEVTDNSHFIASAPGVRAVLVRMQRRIGGELGSVVSEGRDQGSVVFPDADVKFYLDASVEVRARRRFEEMTADGQNVSYEAICRAIAERDGRDRSRAVAPLVKPEEAVEIDTSELRIDQVVETLVAAVEARR